MFFPYHTRYPYYDDRKSESKGNQNSEFNFLLPSKLMKKRLERTIASTLFLDTLSDFTKMSLTIENEITSRTPIWRDITLLHKYIREIKDFRKVLNMRIHLIKKEISRMRGLLKQ